jgi:hypothetical protein
MTKWLALVVVVGTVAWWYWQQSAVEQPVEIELIEAVTVAAEPESQPIIRTPVVPEPEPPAGAVESESEQAVPARDPLLALPAGLDDSDSALRAVAAELAPAFSRWLLPEHQLRKWVLAVDLLADGKLPKRYRPISYNLKPFAVKSSDKGLIAGENNGKRADALVTALTAIDSELLLRYYRAWLPLLEQAYAEQGKPDQFEQRLIAAMDRVLAVPVAPQQALLQRPSVLYKYADESLEASSDVEKLLWRMGDNNRQKLQVWLKPLRQAL